MGDPTSNATGVYAPACWLGVTANTADPVITDTVLPGEITSGSLARAKAVYAHTDGTATYTLTKTFTSDQGVTLAKVGVFNAASSGTLVFETKLNATAQLVSGDQVQITETVSL